MEFRGKYWFLSNMSASEVSLSGVDYPTVENAFQAAKVLDTSHRAQFVSCSAKQAKYLGRRVPLRSDWLVVRDQVMYLLVRQKFMRHPSLKSKLLAIPGHIQEDNAWGDVYWGVCRGEGMNQLGLILMRVRTELLA